MHGLCLWSFLLSFKKTEEKKKKNKEGLLLGHEWLSTFYGHHQSNQRPQLGYPVILLLFLEE